MMRLVKRSMLSNVSHRAPLRVAANRGIRVLRMMGGYSVGLMVYCASMVALGCAGASHGTNNRSVVEFLVTDDPAGPALVGFGADMNPYLYCKPNWQGSGGKVNERNVKDLEAKVIALHPQHVRVFCLLDWFNGKGDLEVAKGDARVKESFIRVVRLAQEAGATVNVTLWYDFWKTPEKSAADFADVLRDLIEREHLTAIQYVTLGNEVNSFEYKIPMDVYNRTYLALGREFKRAGLSDRVKIVSGDLVSTNQDKWFADLGENLSAISGGYSMHMYWDYWDTPKLLWRTDSVQQVASTLPVGEQRPLFITEFGVRGHDAFGKRVQEPGKFIDGTPICDTPIPATQCAWAMIEALNRGYVATVEWECFDAWYDHYMNYGLLAGVDTGWRIRPAYHMLQLFTHTTQPGWRAVKISGAEKGIAVAATKGPNGEMTVYVLNHTTETVKVRIGELGASRKYFVSAWNSEGRSGIKQEGVVKSDKGGEITGWIPGMCLETITTSKPRFE